MSKNERYLKNALPDPAKLAAEIEARQVAASKAVEDLARKHRAKTMTPGERAAWHRTLAKHKKAADAAIAEGRVDWGPQPGDDEWGAVRGEVSLDLAKGIAGDDAEPVAEAPEVDPEVIARMVELAKDVLWPVELYVLDRRYFVNPPRPYEEIARWAKLSGRQEAQRIERQALKKLRARMPRP
jgi:hypothetical protein